MQVFCRRLVSCLQNASLALSCSSFIAMDLGFVGRSSQIFFHFPCKYFHPGLKENRTFQAFIFVRPEAS